MRIVAWITDSPPSMKLVFLSHDPSDVVLSVIESVQSPRFSRPAMILIHGVMIAAICSSKLFEARN
jgi:hypothetical protein